MAKSKKSVGETKGRPAPAATTVKSGVMWRKFLDDWGRLAVPVVAVGVPWGLHSLGVLTGRASGLIIGLEMLVAMAGAFGALLWHLHLPAWARKASIGAAVLYLAGAVFPFVEAVYPGDPAAEVIVTKDGGEVPLAGVEGGWARVDVFAKSFAEASETRRGQGDYRLMIGTTELKGGFSDTVRTVQGRRGRSSQVEDRHYQESTLVRFQAGTPTVKATRLDSAIGPELQVSVYPRIVPPWILYTLLGIVVIFGASLDGLYQDATWRWRFAPWAGAAAVFLVVFHASWEPTNMPGAAILAVIFGGLGGFLLGWLLSLLSRKVVSTIRTRT